MIAILMMMVSCGSRATKQSAVSQWSAGPLAGNQDLLAVAMIDPDVGWAVGDMEPSAGGGVIYKTTDGARTWRPVSRVFEILASVHFASASVGWVAGHGGRIERSDDGGITWKSQRLEREAEILNSIYFIDDRHGWVAGGGGLVLRTSNGGQSWDIIKSGRSEDLWSVRFISPLKGWIVGEGGLILSTTDGGLTWTQALSGVTRALLGLAVDRAGSIIAVGEAGTILRSANGAAWARVESGSSDNLNAVSSPDSALFWCVGARGTALQSDDGGVTWKAAGRLTTRDLLAIEVVTPGHGVAVGQKGFTQVLGQ